MSLGCSWKKSVQICNSWFLAEMWHIAVRVTNYFCMATATRAASESGKCLTCIELLVDMPPQGMTEVFLDLAGVGRVHYFSFGAWHFHRWANSALINSGAQLVVGLLWTICSVLNRVKNMQVMSERVLTVGYELLFEWQEVVRKEQHIGLLGCDWIKEERFEGSALLSAVSAANSQSTFL